MKGSAVRLYEHVTFKVSTKKKNFEFLNKLQDSSPFLCHMKWTGEKEYIKSKFGFQAGSKTKKTEQTIVELERGEIDDESKDTWDKVPVKV